MDPRNKELAYDPDVGIYKPGEARAALKAEQKGILEPPVSRDMDLSGKGNEMGGDFIDGKGVPWDAKDARAGPRIP